MLVIREEELGEDVNITVLENGFFDIKIDPMEPFAREELLTIAQWIIEVVNRGAQND